VNHVVFIVEIFVGRILRAAYGPFRIACPISNKVLIIEYYLPVLFVTNF